MEPKTARLTVLIDPRRKEAFEALCHSQDMTPSQVMRRLIRDFMEQNAPAPTAAPRKSATSRKR
ncbi:CopG family transcriptional regulator [Ramlibacter algicola]|uniref:CopG family transcriptional regulator n=1 Tax=Ramlibacter algicola TaxID=2795217 RepID=A0A934UQP7_9BURK|nr:CopG family transcriptional regulator [Ramlibacter algicola]MBK0392889.1 CopG family transcriptional regulator [Ramlibacter algicola]